MFDREFHRKCATALSSKIDHATRLRAFVGLDGFVDEIIHVVDKRDSAEHFTRIPHIDDLAKRIAAAAGKSANIELVNQRTKIGGNGPIMANALASFGFSVTYLGALGYPNLHPVFAPFSKVAEVHSICDAGHTDALEFEDGKLMFGKTAQLNEISWSSIQERFGREKFVGKFGGSDLVAFVNWTMIPGMSELWESLLKEVCPTMSGAKRTIFFDLADPEKRTETDIKRALEIIPKFEKHFKVILGLNEKEAAEIGAVFGFKAAQDSPEALAELSQKIRNTLKIDTLVVHPVTYALAVGEQGVSMVQGPYISTPLITTGAGDHFNAGFCLGKLLNFDDSLSILTGVATSGYYVRTAASPSIPQIAGMLNDWPAKNEV